jgi:hypothetical protein
MTAADWLWVGLAALVLYVVVRAAAAGGGPKQGERPLFGDDTDEEGS